MKKDEILDMFSELCENYDVELDVPVTINKRFRTTLGRVSSVQFVATGKVEVVKVEFAARLEKETDEFTREIVLHEFAHYALTKKTGQRHYHRDKAFKNMCAFIGCKEDGYCIK